MVYIRYSFDSSFLCDFCILKLFRMLIHRCIFSELHNLDCAIDLKCFCVRMNFRPYDFETGARV